MLVGCESVQTVDLPVFLLAETDMEGRAGPVPLLRMLQRPADGFRAQGSQLFEEAELGGSPTQRLKSATDARHLIIDRQAAPGVTMIAIPDAATDHRTPPASPSRSRLFPIRRTPIVGTPACRPRVRCSRYHWGRDVHGPEPWCRQDRRWNRLWRRRDRGHHDLGHRPGQERCSQRRLPVGMGDTRIRQLLNGRLDLLRRS